MLCDSMPYLAPIILLHGGPSIFGYIHTLVPFLPQSHIVNYAQPGTKENPSSQANLAEQYREVDKRIEPFQRSKPILIGHSWGANLALLYAALHPRNISEVIVIGTAPFSVKLEKKMQFQIWHRLDSKTQEQLDEIDAKIDIAAQNHQYTMLEGLLKKRIQLTSPVYHCNPETEDLLPKTSFSLAGFRQAKGALWKHIERGKIPKLLSSIQIPIHAIHGNQDVIPCLETLAFLKQHILKLTCYRIPEAGHFPWLESKDRFAAALNTILSQHH